MKVRALDVVSYDPCPNCGCTGWIVDTDGQGQYWLLCLAVNVKKDCVETKPLPVGMEIEDDVL